VNGTPAAENISVDAHNGAVDVDGFSATTHVTGSDASADELQVNGLGGRDSARIGADVSSLIGVTVHLV
jgi:hypothetical protein